MMRHVGLDRVKKATDKRNEGIKDCADHSRKCWKRILLCISVLAFVFVTMLPIVVLGFYNHPTGDDYYYGAESHRALEETGSVTAALVEAVRGVGYDYQTWQGTYSAMLLMRLSPTVFSEAAYHWVTAVILGLLVSGIFYLMKVLICDLLGEERHIWLITAGVLSVLAVQTVPTPAESLFWYNGSMYYTGYFAVTLFFWGLLLRLLQSLGTAGELPPDSPAGHTLGSLWKRTGSVAVLVLLAVFLAGGNYISLLPSMIVLVLMTGWYACKKEGRRAWMLGIVTIAMLGGFAVNAMAPGNAVRQSGMWQIAPWKAVLKALVQGVRYMDAWMGRWWLMAAIVLTPFFWGMYRRICFAFRYPLVVVGLIYGIFCSMACPVFYTMNSTGPARVVAICYYGFILSSFAAYWYLLGYYYRWMHTGSDVRQVEKGVRKGHLMIGAGALAVLLLMQLMNGQLMQTTGAKALISLVSGEAAAYQQEYEARVAVLEDQSKETVILDPFLNRPPLLYVGDLNSDPAEPTNVKVALFYGKKSVSVSCAEE